MQAWIIGNWKQNPATNSEAEVLLDALLTAVGHNELSVTNPTITHCQLMVAPSCIHLASVSARVQNTVILCAAQDISAHSDSTGAYTGDCSAQQVADAGATWTILGHSERRQYHEESNETLIHKITHAFAHGLGVILCVGETQAQYDAKQTFAVLNEQLAVIKDWLQQVAVNPLSTVNSNNVTKHLIIAYEPVWAIGTGKVPTVTEVAFTHEYIKRTLASFDASLAEFTVLYGGSVNADNATIFAASPVINGALVGGAALKSESFLAIAEAFSIAKSTAKNNIKTTVKF